MNLCIDQGNSWTKIGVFQNNTLIEAKSYQNFGQSEIATIQQNYKIDNLIVSSVTTDNFDEWLVVNEYKNYLHLTHQTPLPIKNHYQTPETLGKDRLAAVIGAAYICPNSDLLVIDAGTAITYDFIDAAGNYFGGNIAPGVELRYRSLHEHTKKLPLIHPSHNKSLPLLGQNTTSAIECGVIHGVCFEIDGYIDHLKLKYSQLSTFLTGGSIFCFDTKLKNPIFAESNLVLIGLNRILEYNVQK